MGQFASIHEINGKSCKYPLYCMNQAMMSFRLGVKEIGRDIAGDAMIEPGFWHSLCIAGIGMIPAITGIGAIFAGILGVSVPWHAICSAFIHSTLA